MHEFDKCVMYTKYGTKAAEGFVHEFEDSVMKIFTHGDSNDLLPAEEVYIYVYNSVKGECKYKGTVAKIALNDTEIVNIGLISAVQKRDNTRVNKQIKYMMTNKIVNDQKVKLEKPVVISILNLSAQGLYFNCDEKYEHGLKFRLYFKETSRPINLLIEVVRREEYNRSYNYGCRFVGISEKDMDEIFKFVLKEQIAQRRRARIF